VLPVSTVGSRLRQTRKDKGQTLESIATRTKIPVNSLSLLEEDRFSDLPGDIFVRGFLKSYCQVLEIGDEDILDAYLVQTGSPQDVRTSSMPSLRPRDILPGKVRSLSWVLALVLLLILGGVLLAIIFRPGFGTDSSPDGEEPPRETSGKVETTL
jgi:cytoskeletal protein RodZ